MIALTDIKVSITGVLDSYYAVLNISFPFNGKRYCGASYKGDMNLEEWIQKTVLFALNNSPILQRQN